MKMETLKWNLNLRGAGPIPIHAEPLPVGLDQGVAACYVRLLRVMHYTRRMVMIMYTHSTHSIPVCSCYPLRLASLDREEVYRIAIQ